MTQPSRGACVSALLRNAGALRIGALSVAGSAGWLNAADTRKDTASVRTVAHRDAALVDVSLTEATIPKSEARTQRKPLGGDSSRAFLPLRERKRHADLKKRALERAPVELCLWSGMRGEL